MNFVKTIINFLSELTPEKITQFIINPQFSGWLLVFKNSVTILSFVFLGVIIFCLAKSEWLGRMLTWDLREFFSFRPFTLRKTEKEWRKIKTRLGAEIDSENKLAIIEADKMLDNILARMGFEGANLSEKLDKLTAKFMPNIEELKEIRKIHNSIVHDPTYKLSPDEAKRALLIYEKALTDLHAL